MQNFDHIQSDFIRKVVTGQEQNIKAIYGAVYATEYFCEQDVADLSIDSRLILIRETAAESARVCLNAGDISGTLEALREFWGN